MTDIKTTTLDLTVVENATMFKFPSIEQYRTAIRNVRDHHQYIGQSSEGNPIFDRTKGLPKLNYVGTVKLHGTNAGVIFTRKDDNVYTVHYQSRERIITPSDDNAGFAKFMIESAMRDLTLIRGGFVSYAEHYAVFGEWCGGNIQNKVALNQLPKMFVVFAINVDGKWLSKEEVAQIGDASIGIYNIYDFPTYEVEIDFNSPEDSTNRLVELTNAVEQECPVGKQLGVSGVGEGIVWKCVDEGWESPKFWFKVKGEKHQSSKTKTLAPVNTEKLDSIKQFVESVVTDSRCEQGLDKLTEQNLSKDRTNLATFLRWVHDDVVKEETDTIEASGLNKSEVGKAVSSAARNWFFNWEKNNL